MKVLNVSNTLTFIQIFWKTKTFFEKQENRFLVETTEIEKRHFHSKLLCQKAMLRQIEWRLQNGPIIKVEFCQQLLYFFGKFISVLAPLKKSYLMYQRPKCPYSIFFVSAGV